jgi:hypothetical protein
MPYAFTRYNLEDTFTSSLYIFEDQFEFFKSDVPVFVDVISLEYLLNLFLINMMSQFGHRPSNVISCNLALCICVKLVKYRTQFLACKDVLNRNGCRQEFRVVYHLVTMIIDLAYYLVKFNFINFDVGLI